MLMFAVLARERRRLFGLLLLPLFCFVTAHGSAASAASLNVIIRQVNPDGQPQQVTCTPNTKCVLPVSIHTAQGQNETLNVSMSFVPGSLLAEFQTPKGYLYAGTKLPDKMALYEAIWHREIQRGAPSIDSVVLYLPAVPLAPVAPILNAAREATLKISHPAVVTLEIKTISAR